MLLALLEGVLLLFVSAVCLFASAGTLDWPAAWFFLGLTALVFLFGLLVIDPELVRQRAGAEHGLKAWDLPLSTAMFVFLMLAPLAFAGLDVKRWQWSRALPGALQDAGVVCFIAGNAFGLWAARVNRFLVKFVRIQRDRGHHVISTGPYAYVRHPAYLGGIVGYGGVPLILGSRWALLPFGLGALLLAVRTFLEDQMLQAELEGYRAYCQKVRWRLVPGVW